ncbi:MOSC domain-containing protein [Rhodocytophaga aerolata]|uniref:MOSC domain-containing protein n=1 Tax=Rhodocytophaga aerolata TaxID=455078 RepID=A0ABT8RJ46_9BACT|nr:MOSC N-terminal beta barrel domain-containing protein [Rhodocytophaga aerolata]MDO1451223.1 MOSC domain-containing protein [Rhodocytophaga aerolata]
MTLSLSAIYIYPIKSLGGIAVSSALIEETGLQYDRRWMLVDAQNQFMTQRKFAKMALLKVSIEEDQLWVTAPDVPPLTIPFVPQTSEILSVTVWDDTCQSIVVSKEANEWFSSALQQECKLVYMPDTTLRKVDERYAKNKEIVSFADGYPFLLIGEASLADLNSRLAQPVPMNRFRPNLVVNTIEPFVEDTWKTITIGESVFHVVKPCARCILTTIDQQTGKAGKEPLKTLSTYRTFNNKVWFGQNLLSDNADGIKIHIGSPVTVLS